MPAAIVWIGDPKSAGPQLQIRPGSWGHLPITAERSSRANGRDQVLLEDVARFNAIFQVECVAKGLITHLGKFTVREVENHQGKLNKSM